MTRRRSSAPGRVGPDRRRSLPLLPVLGAVVLAVAACGGADPTPTPPGTPSLAPPPMASPASPEPAPTEAPTTETPTAGPTDVPESGAPSATAAGGSGSAAGCAGSDENRDFFVSVAAAVAWPVYCPVLGSGWFVDAGQYRLAGGGRMEITYRGPGGARIELRQGAFCEGDDCVPDGTPIGDAAFGGMSGVLVELDGRYAVVVDDGAAPRWSLVGSGLTADEVRDIGAALLLVDG